MQSKYFFIIGFLILFGLSYNYLDEKLENFLGQGEYVFVERVVDGDTIKTGNKTIRLLGINCNERGEEYYGEAKRFLESLILNKSVKLVYGKDREDRYGRTLAYVFLNEENINKKLIEDGYANFYFPSGRDFYYDEFVIAWESCLQKSVNLCEKSYEQCADCIILKEFDWKNELIVLENNCGKDCFLDEWSIKDEGRKKYIFEDYFLEEGDYVSVIVGKGENRENVLYWNKEDYVWTDTGDTLFLRDSDGKLVLWESY